MIDMNLQTSEIQPLSPRELACFNYLGRGYTVKATARQLNISPRTVEHHLKNIKIKAKLHSKTQLIELYWSLSQHVLQLNNDMLLTT